MISRNLGEFQFNGLIEILETYSSSRPVYVASVINSVDVHDALVFVDPVDDPIMPDSGVAPTC